MMKARHVLILEDEGIVAMLLAKVLKGMGHGISAVVASEAEALAAAARCRPDLMIVTARLREGSGVSAVREIIRSGFVPHVFVGGKDMRTKTPRPDAVVIDKPYRAAELADAIGFVLKAARLEPLSGGAGGRASDDMAICTALDTWPCGSNDG